MAITPFRLFQQMRCLKYLTGMNPQVIPINGRTVINIVMQEDTELLKKL